MDPSYPGESLCGIQGVATKPVLLPVPQQLIRVVLLGLYLWAGSKGLGSCLVV